MKRRWLRRVWLRVPPLALTALVVAGAASASGVQIGGVDTSGYPELRVTVVAPPGSRAPALRENGLPVTGLDALNLGSSKSVVLLVDRSRSMAGNPIADAAAGARTFVAAKTEGDRIAVVAFGHTALALTGFSSSTTDADAALAQLNVDPTSGTALWDAVTLAAHRLAKEVEPGRVIILLTDGQDVSSTNTFAQAVAAVHAAKASVYPIGIAGPGYTPEPLRQLAADTGGTYHEASSSTELSAIYASISRTLARSWQLRYPTTARPGESIRLAAAVPGFRPATRAVVLGAAAAASAPSGPTVLSRSQWTSGAMPLVISAGVGLLVLLACGFMFASRNGLWLRARLEPHLTPVRKRAKARRKHERRAVLRRILLATEHAFANVKQFRRLQRLLQRADLPLRAAELLYICLGSGLLATLLGAVVGLPFLFLIFFMGLGGALPVMFVSVKAKARVKAFDNQLPDMLITIAASLKAGHSFRQAIQAVVDEGADPAAGEFKRVLAETRLGRSMDDALADVGERVGSKNLSFVITAVTIQRQIGGSLAGLFDVVADTVRQRQQFARKIRGLTAMGRMSAYVLAGLPFLIALAVTAMNPGYMRPLYHSATGHELIFLGLGMMTFGSLILKKIVSFRG